MNELEVTDRKTYPCWSNFTSLQPSQHLFEMSTNEMNTSASDPFRHTCLIPYVDPASAPPAVADKLKILPFRRNIFYILGHSQGLFPHLMGIVGGCFNGQVRGVQLLDWVGYSATCPC